MWPFNSSSVSIISRKREQRQNALKGARVYFEAEHLEFLQADATAIVENIANGRWTATQVLEAYIARAAEAHHHTNCLTEVMFATARAHAKALDDQFVVTGRVVGPLHGVPMSFKDQYQVVGYDTTVGFSQWANKPADRNADTVELLAAAGAIPFVKTNIPQTMLAFECANPLWGRTSNPFASAYTCGGSSGGEAAVLAVSGSALGFGSDIGGSIRIPAGFCGIYALKPGHGRVSMGGVLSSNPGFEGINTVVGPMGRSVRDLTLAARLVFGQPDDLGVVAPVPFREVELPRKLKFGFYTDDGFVKASPVGERAVMETVTALRQAGHECVELDWPFSCEPLHILSNYFSADGYKTLLKPVGPDSKDASLYLAIYPPRIPRWLRITLSWIIENVIGDAQFAALARDARPKSIAELYQVNVARKDLDRRLRTEIWDVHGLDAIIAPVQAMPTIPHGATRELSPLANATMMYNAANSPVGVVPVTRVDPAKDALTSGKWPVSKTGGSWLVAQACARAYDPVAMTGVPVGVQIIGRKWEDEKVLAVMDVVDRVLGERGFGPSAGAAVSLNT